MTTFQELLQQNIDIKNDIKDALSIHQSMDSVDYDEYADIIRGALTKRWGFKISLSDSNPETSITYLHDAVGATPVSFAWDGSTGKGAFSWGSWKPFFDAFFRPVMLKSNGDVDYELNHDDQTKKLDGVTASDVANTSYDGNAMVECRRIWTKVSADATYIYVEFSNIQYDGDYHAYAFTNAAGQIQPAAYYSMFEGSNVSSKLRSLATGAVMASQVGATEIDYADNNGAGWYITYYSLHNLLALLHVLLGKSLDTQTVFGRGNESGADYIAPGAMVAEGPFAGYNTTDSAKTVKTFYIEHFWANYWKRCAGLLLRNDAGTAKIYVKHTPTYNETADGYIDTGVTPGGTSGEYIKAMNAANDALIPSTNTGGSASTFFMDGFWFATPATAGACHYALVSASRDYAGLCGAFTVVLNTPLSTANPDIGARLSFLK
jgi:hypothetical protein